MWSAGFALLKENSAVKEHHAAGGLTAPKPDLFCAFNAHLENPSRSPSAIDFGDDEMIRNFSFAHLEKLANHFLVDGLERGFHPGPVLNFTRNKNKIQENIKQYTCFPWLVGEWKHAGKSNTQSEQHMQRQAANCAAAALAILANLAVKGQRRPDIKEIRPVVAITSVGAEVRAWVAYVDKVDITKYEFVCHRRHTLAVELMIIGDASYLGRTADRIGRCDTIVPYY